MMRLKSLKIERVTYGDHEGTFAGAMKFDNEIGSIEVKLSAKQCDELFKVCAEGIISTAKDAAAELTCSVIEHDKALRLEAGE
jgi:hypothetical protein